MGGKDRNLSVALVGFSQAGESSVRPQDEDQPMSPDDVQASEEVSSCKSTFVSNTADTQRNSRTRVDASASSIVRHCSEEEENKPSAFSQ